MKILFTSAIIPQYYDERKDEYIKSILTLFNFLNKEDIYNIECYLYDNSYLEDYFKNVFYSKTHKPLRNKGVKEIMALKSFIDKCDFDDSDMIIKHTGRYRFLSDYFIKYVNENDFDVVVREGTVDQYFTGTFAIKCNLFKIFLEKIDIVDMESKMINIEKKIYDFINDMNLNKKVLKHIDVYSKINNSDIFIW